MCVFHGFCFFSSFFFFWGGGYFHMEVTATFVAVSVESVMYFGGCAL